MRRASRILVPAAVLGMIGIGALAFLGPSDLPRLDFARFLSWNSSAPDGQAPASPKAGLTEKVDSQNSVRDAAAPAGSSREAAAAGSPSVGTSAASSSGPAPGAGSPPIKIDFARIVAQGTSVVGGYAPPGSRVSVHGNGEVVATVTASESGQWSAVVTRPFTPGPLALTITSDDLSVVGQESPALVVDVPKDSGHVELAAAEAKPKPILPPRPETARSRAVSDFAALVERARTKGGDGNAAAAAQAAGFVPVPITFVSGEATMTSDGIRAARLLAEFVRIVRPGSITLSGHADERGGESYNLELSQRRLEAIQAFLRKNGYDGALALLARGKSEPYQGIDRHTASISQIQQADRRVELRLAE